MIPLVGHVNELKATQALLEAEAASVVKAAGVKIDYKFGTMIEIPRACWVADEIAKYAEFFSFGTNDLTQMTFGYSRDDAEGGFLSSTSRTRSCPYNPFQSLDPVIVQEMKMAVELGRKTRPTSRSASAASTAATRCPSGSATDRPELRLLLAVPGAGGPPGGGPGGPGRRGGARQVARPFARNRTPGGKPPGVPILVTTASWPRPMAQDWAGDSWAAGRLAHAVGSGRHAPAACTIAAGRAYHWNCPAPTAPGGRSALRYGAPVAA